MTQHLPDLTGEPLEREAVFGAATRKRFGDCYPERPHKLEHGLRDHPLAAGQG